MVKCFGAWVRHELNGVYKETEISTVEQNVVSIQPAKNPNDDITVDEEQENVKFCCLSGCLTIIFAVVLFFFALPTGVLLCVYASYNAEKEVLIVGVVLAISPLISVPLIVVVLVNRRKLRQLRQRKVSVETADNNNNGTRF